METLRERIETSFNKFLSDECLVGEWKITLSIDLYQRYKKYCTDHCIPAVSSVQLGRMMAQTGFEHIRTYQGKRQHRAWYGVTLKNNPQIP